MYELVNWRLRSPHVMDIKEIAYSVPLKSEIVTEFGYWPEFIEFAH